MSLTHLSLFSGIGGLDIAAEKAGFETVGQCEWWDYARGRLEKHWPGIPRWRDIRSLTGESFYERTGLRTVDVISGGFPCQPFSLAGKRRGQEDDRYLWPEMLRVIEELKPTWVIGENVAGLVSMVKPGATVGVESRSINRQPDADFYEAVLSRQEDFLLLDLIRDLERIGYEVQPFIIPACAVGASHRRDRLALIAHANKIRRDVRRPGRQRVHRDTPCHETGTGGEDVAHAHGGGHLHGRHEIHPAETRQHAQCQPLGCGEDVADTKRVRRGRTAINPIMTKNGTVRHRNKQGGQSYARLDQVVAMFPTPKASDCKGSGPPGSKSQEHDAKKGNLKGYILMPTPTARDWKSPDLNPETEMFSAKTELNTIVGGQLNPAWVEWLMGFPPGWTDIG